MANIKFYRSANAPSNPVEGYVWFNSDDRTINLYKNGDWEKYSGIIGAAYTNNVLTITPAVGDAVAVDLSDMASAETLDTLSQNLNTLQTSFNTLSGEFSDVKTTVGTHTAAIATVVSKLKNIEEKEGAVKDYVDNKMSTHEAARETIDAGFNTRIETLETTTSTLSGKIDTLNGTDTVTGSVANKIKTAIDGLDANVTGNGALVNVTVTQADGKVTGVSVADSGVASASDLAEVEEALADEITRATNAEAGLQGAINTEKNRVDTLEGSDSGKSVRTIANEELAAQLLGENNADDNFKTLQELAAWLEDHPESAAAMNEAIGANATAISDLTGRVGTLESSKDAYKAADEATLASAKSYADGKAATAESNAKAYTDELADVVDNNTTDIATNTANITEIKGQIETINTTIEENELTVASALTDLDNRINSLASGTISSVTGQGYITVTTTDGAAVVNATTGSVANGIDALALASDVKSYVDSTWAWGEF